MKRLSCGQQKNGHRPGAVRVFPRKTNIKITLSAHPPPPSLPPPTPPELGPTVITLVLCTRGMENGAPTPIATPADRSIVRPPPPTP